MHFLLKLGLVFYKCWIKHISSNFSLYFIDLSVPVLDLSFLLNFQAFLTTHIILITITWYLRYFSSIWQLESKCRPGFSTCARTKWKCRTGSFFFAYGLCIISLILSNIGSNTIRFYFPQASLRRFMHISISIESLKFCSWRAGRNVCSCLALYLFW